VAPVPVLLPLLRENVVDVSQRLAGVVRVLGRHPVLSPESLDRAVLRTVFGSRLSQLG
jgi:Trm5-related predicted tRNA methylase